MNRRQFTTRLMAVFAAPAVPVAAVSTAVATPTIAITAGATSWAQYLTAMHNTCTPAMLKSVLNLNIEAAQTIHANMVTQGVIKDGNRVIKAVQDRIDHHLKAPDMHATRPAVAEDLNALTDIWHDGWHEAHAEHVPSDLIGLRDYDSLRIRMENMLETTDVIGPVGAPVGFCTVKNDEIYQFYISPDARGNGTADALMGAGEKRLLAAGFETAEVWVIPQNPRAIAFYRRNGWHGDDVVDVPLDTLEGTYLLPCMVLKKQLK